MSDVTGANVPATISSFCCTIPFTLNGMLHYTCTDNGASFGCFYGDHEWKECRQPEGKRPKQTAVNLHLAPIKEKYKNFIQLYSHAFYFLVYNERLLIYSWFLYPKKAGASVVFIIFGLQCYRFPTDLRGHGNDSSECQPGCRCAATDYQRLDPDAEKGHRRFGVVQPELDGISWRVWITDSQRQLLAGTCDDPAFAAVWQRQTQNRGKPAAI